MQELDNIYNQINNNLDELFEKYRFLNILQTKKKCLASYNDAKRKVEKGETNVNFLVYYQIYVKILQTEKNFVMMELAPKNITKNITVNQSRGNTYLVTCNGYRWIKIIGGNKNRIDNSADIDYYGNFSVLESLETFKEESENSSYLPYNHKPEVMVIFHQMPSEILCQEIQKLGIVVKSSDNFPLPHPSIAHNTEFSTKIANLDVSTLITLCSELSNIKDPNIQISKRIQAKMECCGFSGIVDIIENKNKLMEKINQYEKIIVCQSAWDTFLKLVDYNGGENEKKRIGEIEKFVTIVPDEPNERILNLPNSKNELYKIIFGTGETHGACTFTGNTSFVNNTESSEIHVVHQLHRSFQLAEKVLFDK